MKLKFHLITDGEDSEVGLSKETDLNDYDLVKRNEKIVGKTIKSFGMIYENGEIEFHMELE